MSEIITPRSLKAEITLNLGRLQDAREAGDSQSLQDLFETRMNRGLDEYMDMIKFASQVTQEFEPVQA